MSVAFPDGALEFCAAQFAPRVPKARTWATPGAMARGLDRTTRQTPALDRIDRLLAELADGRTEKAMIFVPPQEGKSQRVSRWFPLWLLEHDPTLRIAIVSYNATKAERWGRQIRREIRTRPELGITLQQDSQAAGRFETTAGGGIICVGLDGGITGEPVDVLIIDDPIRGRAEAESSTYREAAWDWWESNGATRMSARGRIVLMMTRWHADDLAARLLTNEPGEWTVLRIPAVAGKRTTVKGGDGAQATRWVADGPDPLGRAPGEELTSVQRRRPGHFLELAGKRSAYVWRSVYQQDPVAAEGNLFRRADFRFWHPMPDHMHAGRRLDLDGSETHLRDCWRFVTVDLAASVRTSADFTVAAVWAIDLDANLILLDRARARLAETDHWDLVRPLCSRWETQDVYVEKGFIGTTLVIDATRAGVAVQGLTAESDKLTRALPAVARCAAHRVWFPAQAPWLDEWIDELAEFPSGAHDDQVDTLSYAARIMSAHWLAPETHELTQRRREGAPSLAGAGIDDAYAAATGSDQPPDLYHMDL